MSLKPKLFTALMACGAVFLQGATPSHAETAGPAGSPAQALARLEKGNARFAAGKTVHSHTTAARIANIAKEGQHPFATVITCSDSRVPVEEVFDQGVGDVFVIRVAGNVCDVDEVGSIEYGVDDLETPLMVVLGHTECGAVTAVVTQAELHGSIPQLVDNIEPAVAKAQESHPEQERLLAYTGGPDEAVSAHTATPVSQHGEAATHSANVQNATETTECAFTSCHREHNFRRRNLESLVRDD